MHEVWVRFHNWWWFQIVLEFSPLLGDESHFDQYSSTGLVQPPTRESLEMIFQVGGGPGCYFSPIIRESQSCFLLYYVFLPNHRDPET